MTEYVCHKCGVKTSLTPFKSKANSVPTTDKCPNCGKGDDFEYL